MVKGVRVAEVAAVSSALGNETRASWSDLVQVEGRGLGDRGDTRRDDPCCRRSWIRWTEDRQARYDPHRREAGFGPPGAARRENYERYRGRNHARQPLL